MFDSSFTIQSLGPEIRISDYRKFPFLGNESARHLFLNATASAAQSRTVSPNLVKHTKAGREVYIVSDLASDLILRKIAGNVTNAYRIRSPDRQSISRCISSLLGEGAPFQVVTIDIRDFYASVDRDTLLKILIHDDILNSDSIHMLESYFLKLDSDGIRGLPQGHKLSAVLANFYLNVIDQSLIQTAGVIFYSRFVDDIVLIRTHGSHSNKTLSFFDSTLPPNLTVNMSKFRQIDFVYKKPKPNPVVEGGFDFLSYHFSCTHLKRLKVGNGICRDIIVDIADRKVKKIKSKIIIAAKSYLRDKNFSLFLSRIQLLSSNYQMNDFNANRWRLCGIYYSYPLLSKPEGSGLASLDKFLIGLVTGSKQRLSLELRKSITRRMRSEILSHSFVAGYQQRRFYHFSTVQLQSINECWKNVKL